MFKTIEYLTHELASFRKSCCYLFKKLLFINLIMWSWPSLAQTWLVLDIGIIGAASQDILESAMKQAATEDYVGIIIRLDTPGGSLENTRSMVKSIMASNVPIVVWVGPPGSRAASAGSFITLASHIAAMAPGTNIGAAHPVMIGGSLEEGSESARKIENDTVAFIESIAESRGRNKEMARSFVATSVSLAAEEAKEHKIIDFIAKDLEELFAKLDQLEITLAQQNKIKLETRNYKIVTFEKSYRQILLEILSNPNVFYLLFLCGLIGIGYELTHPGFILPGVAGAISLILAMVATSILPVNFGALALMLTGIAFLVAEAFLPSFGALGIGGFLAFVLGSIFLVDPMNAEGLRISLFTILPGAVVVAIAFLSLGFLIYRSIHAKVESGSKSILRQECFACEDFRDGQGQVKVQGTFWNARVHENETLTIVKNDRLIVLSQENLVLVVARKKH